MKHFELGLIEGFYGKPWSWETRQAYASFLKKAGYAFYFYAPKSDSYLRRKWREPLPQDHLRNLDQLTEHYRGAGVEFGVGFSPFEIYLSFDAEARARLLDRIAVFNQLGVNRLAILFDDMRSAPALAQTQADVLHLIREKSTARKIFICPTYYSLDPVLDRMFGARPSDYLQKLGELLDPSIHIFWTGEEICSKSYTLEHIKWIDSEVGRKITLWDNYPVNDGPKMCKFLHVDAFRGRPPELATALRAHVVNPMNQAELSKIPLLTLADSYRAALGGYSPQASFLAAATQIGSPSLAKALLESLPLLQQKGLDRLTEQERAALTATFSRFNHPLSQEVLLWLQGHYTVDRNVFLTQ